MKTPKKKTSSTNHKPSTPFFNKSGEQSFFAQNPSTPFFNIQPKLSIGQPNDKYEKEADAMADQVTNTSVSQQPESVIQRKCNTCEEEVQTKPLFENISHSIKKSTSNHKVQRSLSLDEEEPIQAKSNSRSDTSVHSNFETQLKTSANSGVQLSPDTRQEMESGFGADFSKVRIHNNSTAASLSNKINAQAFTHGNNIYFNQGKFAPSSNSGKHLLAHELTHTIQQGASIKKKPSEIIQAKCADADCKSTDPLTPACPKPNTFRTNPKLESIRQSVFESASDYDLLEKGDADDAVVLIQALLLNTNCIGYDRIGLRDEMSRKEFGRETDRAIRQFQSGRNGANGMPLSVDGDIGPGTLSAMDIELSLAPIAPAKPPEAVGNCFGKAKHGPGESQVIKQTTLPPIFPFLPAFAAWEISNFDIDKHFLKTEHRAFIRSQIIPKINEAQLKHPTASDLHLRIIGEASTTGDDAHNFDLSSRRGSCTAETLIAEGIDSSLIKTPLSPFGEQLAQVRRTISGAPIIDGVEDRTARKVSIILDLSSTKDDCSDTDKMLPSNKYLAKIACAGFNNFRVNIGHFENPAQPVYREFIWTSSIPFLDDCQFQIPSFADIFRPVSASTELQLATKNPDEANAPSSFQGSVKLLSNLRQGEFLKTSGSEAGSPFSIFIPGEWNSIDCLNEHQDTDGFLRPIGPVKCGVVPAPPTVDDCYPSQEDCPPETRQASAKEYVAQMIRVSGNPLDAIKLIKKLAKAASVIDKILDFIGIKAILGGAIITIGSKDLDAPIYRTFIFAGGGFSGAGGSSINANKMSSKKFTLETPKQLEKSSSGLFLQDSDFEGSAKLKIIGGTNKEQLTIDGNGVSKTIDLYGILCDGDSTRSASGTLKPITNASCGNLPTLPFAEEDCKDDCSDSLKLSEFHRFKFKTGRASLSAIPFAGKRIANQMGNCGATLAFINIGNRPKEGETEIYRKFLFIGKNDPCKFTVEKKNFNEFFIDPKALTYGDPNDITSFSDFAGIAKVDTLGLLKMFDFPPTKYTLPGNYEAGCKDGKLEGVIIPLSSVECGETPEPFHTTAIDPDLSQRCEDFKTGDPALVNRHVAKLGGSYKPVVDSISQGPALRFPAESYKELFSKIGETISHGVFVGKTIGNVPVVSFITFQVNKGIRLPSGFYVFDVTVLNEPCSFDSSGKPTLIYPKDCEEGFIGPGNTIVFPIIEKKKEKPKEKEDTIIDTIEDVLTPSLLIPESVAQNGAPAVQAKCSECEEQEVRPKRIPSINLSSISDSNTNLTANDQFEKGLSSSGNGSEMSEATRQKMEASFNTDFNHVKIHTGTKASELSQSIGARAFTHGSDIYFNQGEFNPGTKSGDHLLAHELTHVVQQSNFRNPTFETNTNTNIQNGKPHQIQRRALPNVINHPIANYEIDLPNTGSETIRGNIMAEQELSLSQEDQGTFAGFEHEATALNIAHQNITRVIAIVQDDQNRYHVYKTNLSPFETDVQYRIIPFENYRRTQNIRFENLHQGASESNRSDWVERARSAATLRSNDHLMEANRIYTQLVAEATGTNISEFHIVERSFEYQPGFNFSIHMTNANGRGGIRSLPTDRTSEIPSPVLVIGVGVFNRNSPDDVRSTFIHELTHYTQAQRSIQLLENWRNSDSNQSFQTWLNLQERQGQITDLEHSLTIGFINNDDDNTETLAHLNAFILSYPSDNLQRPDPYIFRSLYSMTNYWLGADRPLQQRAIDRIISFFNGLDQEHQEKLSNYVAVQKNLESNEHQRIPFRRLDELIND